jgi:hypothetical protein
MIFDLLDKTTSLKLLNKGNSGSVVYISEEKDKSFSNYLVILKNNQINIKMTDIESINSLFISIKKRGPLEPEEVENKGCNCEKVKGKWLQHCFFYQKDKKAKREKAYNK